MDAEEEVEQQAKASSPKRPRVEAEPAVEAAAEPVGEAVSQGEAAEESAVDGAVAVSTVRPPSSSRIPRPVGNPVASSSSSEVVT